MWNIFGDSDDITFGSASSGAPVSRPSRDTPLPERRQSSHSPVRSFERAERPRVHQDRPKSSGPMTPPVPLSLSASLTELVTSMKPTYLPPVSPDLIRIVALSWANHVDPLFLARTGDVTIMFGTGFSTIENSGNIYPAFPDMRLIDSEKDHLAGWVLLESGFDLTTFQMVLEMLGFPFVYGSRDVIAYIRDNVKDSVFLEKCRFFELFSPDSEERKIAEFTLKNTPIWLSVSVGNKWYIDALRTIDTTALIPGWYPVLSRTSDGYVLSASDMSFSHGDIIDILGSKIIKHTLKFTFDTFYRDAQSIWVAAWYALKDRSELASNGVLTFVLEEDARARAIVGHIFIDSRGFVHAHEMMSVHKQILKWIRHIYEDAIIKNPRIERWELVQTLRRELTKYCYLVTGRTPVVMPIIIER